MVDNMLKDYPLLMWALSKVVIHLGLVLVVSIFVCQNPALIIYPIIIKAIVI